MNKYLLSNTFFLLFTTTLFAQIKPIQNLEYSQGYSYGGNPSNQFSMAWEEPAKPHDSILGYRIYREEEFYVFRERSYYSNLVDAVTGEYQEGSLEFLFYENSGYEGFYTHVNAVYFVDSAIAESTYIDSVKTDPIVLNTKQSKRKEIKFYPNPTSGILNISAKNVEKIKLRNLQGRSINVELSNAKIDLSEQPDGIYLLEIEFQNGNKIVKKVVKN